jgi:hypothetical protein
MTANLSSAMRYLSGMALSFLLGCVGGMICGSAILSLCALAGRIQTTGENYIGFWDWGLFLVGSMYGGSVGAIAGPIAYATVVRAIGFRKATVVGAIGTIVCGLAGSLVSPAFGLPAGVVGFFAALVITRIKYARQNNEAAA